MNVLIAAVAATLLAASAERAPDLVRPRDPARAAEARAAASAFLRHLYAVHVSLRGCAEAARQYGKPEFLPGIGLDEARRAMALVDEASRAVSLDVDGIWAEVSPLATVTAEALKADTAENVANCARIGGVFRIDLANLQNALRALGWIRSLIEKDF